MNVGCSARSHLAVWRAVILLLLVFSTSTTSRLARPETTEHKTPPYKFVSLSRSDETFLEDLERRSFDYFWQQADPNTGLVLDRTRTDGSPSDENHRVIASIAATGFGLTALCIATERRWVSRAAARTRVRNTLSFFADRALQEHGWFYHWMDYTNGERKWKSELSSIDTALLLAGVLTAKQYFGNDAEIVRLATKIYERIDFPWMLANHPTLLSMGWYPESGFIKARWDNYSEHPMLYLMAIGSPTHPLKPESWYAWERNWNQYAGYTYLGKTPLFTYQYSQAWVDFRNRHEDKGEHVDYFENSVQATLAHRQFCIDLAKEFLWTKRLGYQCLGQCKGLRRLGWPTASFSDRRHRRSVCASRLIDVCSQTGDGCIAHHEVEVRQRDLWQIRIH